MAKIESDKTISSLIFLQKDHIITDYQSHKVISYSQIGQNLHISPDPFEMDQDGLDAAFDSIVQVSHA